MNKELEAKYGKRNLRVLDITIPAEDGYEEEKYQLIIRKPTRQVIEAIAAAKGDESQAAKIMVNNCVVGGDLEALDDGQVYVTALEFVGKLFKSATAELKKY